MSGFYGIGHNTFDNRGMPWISRFASGIDTVPACSVCRRGGRRASSNVSALLEDKTARHWPDLLGCGELLLFVVSERFVDALATNGMNVEVGGRVVIQEPVSKGLRVSDAPAYHWVDGERHRAAAMDYEASGFVDPVHCNGCGRVSYDIAKTNARRHGNPPAPIVFHYDETSGLELFTTDRTALSFFCTERVLQCAKRHRLSNVAFRPVEQGVLAKPVKY